MQLDLATIAKSRDLDNYYGGWLYWLLYLKGYLQYAESGTVGSGNIYYDYLTKYYFLHNPDPGLMWLRSDPHATAERIMRRFRDADFFREHVAEDPGWLDKVAPVRIVVSDPPSEPVLQVYEIGSNSPLKARLLDGWHRLFSARLFGVQKLRCEVDQESHQLDHVRGNIEHFSFDGRRLIIRGWCVKVDRRIDMVEVRVGGRTVARGDVTNRPDAKQLSSKIPHANCLGFAIDTKCLLPTDEFICFDILLLNNWLPVGAIVACYLPGMYKERSWPPAPLAQRLVGESEPDKLAFRSIKCLHEMLLPIQRQRSLDSVTSVLNWGCGLLEFFLPNFLPKAELVTVDFDKEIVEWCKQSRLPGVFRAIDYIPPTDLPSESFDLVLSYAVLGHLPRDLQRSWLGELHRIVKPEGLLAVTVHGELTRPLVDSPSILSELGSDGISDSTADKRLRSVRKAGYDRVTYQTKAYTLQEYSKWFDIVDYIEGGTNDLLDLVIMARREG